MDKKVLKNILKWIITIVLFLIVFIKAGLFDEVGRNKLIDNLKDVRIEYVILSVFILFLLNFSSAIKWYMLLISRNIKIELWRVWAFNYMGKFFNLILPTSLGGDVIRILQLGKFTGNKHTAAASVIVDRFTGMLTLITMAVIAVFLNLKLFNETWLSIALGFGVLFMTILAWLIFDKRPFLLFQKIFSNKVEMINKIFLRIEKIRQPIFDIKKDRKAVIWAIINSLIFHFLIAVCIWLSSKAFGDELSFISIIVAVPVILFIMNIPFSIGGIGLMEFAYVFTLPLFGASVSLALSTVLLVRAEGILDAIIGGVLYSALKRDKPLINELAKN